MWNWIHYLDPDDVPACGCAELTRSRTFASGLVTCPDCRRVLEERRGAEWKAHRVDALERSRTGV